MMDDSQIHEDDNYYPGLGVRDFLHHSQAVQHVATIVIVNDLLKPYHLSRFFAVWAIFAVMGLSHLTISAILVVLSILGYYLHVWL